jgi:hypothetical protein
VVAQLGGEVQVSQQIYNNFGVYSVGIMATLKLSRTLSMPELLLIAPFITHTHLLSYLARKDIEVKSLEQLIVKNSRWFANFNERFYGGIAGTLNAIQFLNDIELILWDGRSCTIAEDLPYDPAMGTRAGKIYKASENIVSLISKDVANAYTNLRIQL